jgi:8-oxo-dGTP pyrophosphatase MutT (NUDIX family)
MSEKPPTPQPASTIILVDESCRLYLVKRHGKSGFMAGAHVFPGGRVDDADRAVAASLPPALRAAGEKLLKLGVPSLDEALLLLVAGVRETVEECGILLARQDGAVASGREATLVHEFILAGGHFADAMKKFQLVPAVDMLTPFAWWITPEAEPRRYDTRFFLAQAPSSQRATVDSREITSGEWMRPADALARYARREITLAPPTLVTIEDLATMRSFDAMRASAVTAGRPICPKMITVESGLVLALPGDPLHDVKEPVFPGVRTRIAMDGEGRLSSAIETKKKA